MMHAVHTTPLSGDDAADETARASRRKKRCAAELSVQRLFFFFNAQFMGSVLGKTRDILASPRLPKPQEEETDYDRRRRGPLME
jgi:hypothetical protein